MKYILPMMIIMSLSWIYWSIKYPSELWHTLIFRKDDGYIVMGLLIWVYLFGFVGTVVYLCKFIP